jgi:TRAP-type C4-dicarboxylate transport system permease small subunit
MLLGLKKTISLGLEYLALAFAALAGVGLVAIVGTIVTSVIMRKFANTPLHITEEVVGLLLSVALFLGLPMVTLLSKHVHVSLLTAYTTGRPKSLLQMAALFVGVVFLGWLIWQTIPWFEFAFKRGIKTETTRILLYPWMALMPLSLTLACTILIARLFGVIDRSSASEAQTLSLDKAH